MTHSHVRFQVDPGSAPLLPAWMEEVATVAHVIKETGVLAAIEQKVQFARVRLVCMTQLILLLSCSPMCKY
jgi:hypothetical protein